MSPHADPEKAREYRREYRRRRAATDPDFNKRARANERRYYARNVEKRREKSLEQRKQNPMAFREWNLKRLYGISHADYERMLADQGGRCAICGSCDPGPKKKYFSVDHDHETGKVRGLLCDYCNNGLGRFRDRLDVLLKAVEYLRKHVTG